MFDSIATRYDLLNHVLSAGIDRSWRRRAIASLGLKGGERVLDLCTGTADLAIAAAAVRPAPSRVVGVDFAGAMLDVGREKLRREKLDGRVTLVRGDATRIPAATASVDALTVAFGIRNVNDVDAACDEMQRVVRPGGRLAILEFAVPTIPGVRAAYLWYFNHILPRIGRLVSHHQAAYGYLPASVGAFASPDEFVATLRNHGFGDATAVRLTFGIVCLYTANGVSRDEKPHGYFTHAGCYTCCNSLMYFDFEDYRPDISPVGRAISWREGVLLSIIAHLCAVIILLMFPQLLTKGYNPVAVVPVAQQPRGDTPTFVFVQPRLDTQAPKPPDRGEASDKDRIARAPERRRSRRTTCRSRAAIRQSACRRMPAARAARGPRPNPAAGQQAQNIDPAPPASQPLQPLPDLRSALQIPSPSQQQASNTGVGGRAATPGGSLGESLRNLQRYTQTFANLDGGGGQFGPDIQFDTKGVEFGPWIRRFIAQIKRNWIVPYSAMLDNQEPRVVITFNVHKDTGLISDLRILAPSAINAFDQSAFGALRLSSPTQPLPSEYPSEAAFFTVTFGLVHQTR